MFYLYTVKKKREKTNTIRRAKLSSYYGTSLVPPTTSYICSFVHCYPFRGEFRACFFRRKKLKNIDKTKLQEYSTLTILYDTIPLYFLGCYATTTLIMSCTSNCANHKQCSRLKLCTLRKRRKKITERITESISSPSLVPASVWVLL